MAAPGAKCHDLFGNVCVGEKFSPWADRRRTSAGNAGLAVPTETGTR